MIRSLTTFLVFFSSIFVFSANAQTHFADTLQPKTDSAAVIPQKLQAFTDSVYKVYAAKNPSGGKQLMPPVYFDKFMSKYFSYVTTTKAGLPDGNSVSLQPSSDATTVQANLSYKNKNTIYNAGLKADYSNNIANLFSGKDVIGNTSFYTNISLLSLGTRRIVYNANLARNNNDAKKIRIHQFMTDLNARYKINYQQDSAAYYQAIADYNSAADFYRENAIDSNTSELVQKRQAIYAAGAKLKAYQLNERKDLYRLNDLTNDITGQLTDSLNTILDTLEVNNTAWESFQFSYFSGGITYIQQAFKTYDSSLTFSTRIADQTFNNVGLTISYNYIFQRSAEYAKRNPGTRPQSWYLSAAYTLGNDLNYLTLDTTTVLTIHQVPGSDTTYQFQSQGLVRDISGLAKKISWNHTFAIQSTLALTQSNFMGVTTALSTKISPFACPVYSGTLGLMFRFVNSDSQQSKVNFQLFLQLNDWGDSKGAGKSTWQRKVIGFNATIPFSNLFF